MPRLLFRNPAKNDVVIFDVEGSLNLANTVLNDIEYTIVHSRMEVVHVTLSLFVLILINAAKCLITNNYNLGGVKRCSPFGFIYRVYLFSCIKYIKPKVVLTFIDNNRIFHWISRSYENCEFYSIQNGVRNDAKRLCYEGQNNRDSNILSRSVHFTTDIMSMPHFFCYGKYEIDLYKKHGHEVDNFYPVGSLKGGFYKTCVASNNIKVDFDICLVSDQLLSFPKEHKLSRFELGVGHLHTLVQKYLVEKGPTCCVAMRSADKREQSIEEEYFVNLFGDGVKIIKRSDIQLSTYDAMDRSSVVVALNSTAAFEAFGWGKKVLFCNLSGDDFYQSSLPEICTMSVNDYEMFKTKLDYLRQLDENEYSKLTKSHAQYLMNYDFDNPAHVVIRKMILEHLK